MSSLLWQTDKHEAIDLARSEQKPILLDFYHAESIGCQQMEAVTYANRDVCNFINTYLTPLRLDTSKGVKDPDCHHIWTPTLVVLTPEGLEIQRTTGFLHPKDFLAVMHLGLAKVRLDAGKYDTAIIPIKSILETFYHNNYVPEAIYWCGVAMYKMTKDPAKLKEAHDRLVKEYPDHIWTKRADPFRLL